MGRIGGGAADFDEDTDEQTKVLLGKNMELHRGGENVDETQGREEAVEILQEPLINGRNARQTMLMHKQAHGSGVDLDFPAATQIEEALRGYELEHMVPFFGTAAIPHPPNGGQHLGLWSVGPMLESQR